MTPESTDPRIQCRPGGPIMTNSFALEDPATGAWAIIDPVEECDEIWGDLIARTPPCMILITHGHFDHVGGAAAMLERWPDVPVYVHADSKAMIGDLDLSGAAQFGIPFRTATPSELYREGDRLDLGSLSIGVIEAPGHCPGSVLLLCGRHCFAGDVIFEEGVGRWDLPGGSYDVLAESIRSKVMTLPDDTRLYPGHGAPTTVGRARRGNSYVVQMLDETGGSFA